MIRFPIKIKNLLKGDLLHYNSVEEYWHDNKYIIDEFNDDDFGLSSIYPIISGKILHVTSVQNFKLIKKSKFIKPNLGGFTYNHKQSPHNYGVKRGWVCLFDFRAHWQHICETHENWRQFFLGDNEKSILITFDSYNLDLESNPQMTENPREFYIPWVEVWAKRPIAIELADKIVMLSTRRQSNCRILNHN